MRESYPVAYFYSHISVIEPVMFSVFMVDHLFNIQEISNAVRRLPGVNAIGTMIYYNAIVLPPITRIKMMDCISNWSENNKMS